MNEYSTKDLADSLFFAMRYALVRRTYASIVVQITIKKHREIFTDREFEMMIKEIDSDAVKKGEWEEFRSWLVHQL